MKLRQGANGHYFVEGTINSQKTVFMIDTGASSVSLPSSLAYAAGLSCHQRMILQTGNGNSVACQTQIGKLEFGSFSFKDVDAVIAPQLDQPLLGMNILRQLRMEQDNGELHLTRK